MDSRLPSPFSAESTNNNNNSVMQTDKGPGVPGFVFLSQPSYDKFGRTRGGFHSQQRMRGHPQMAGPGPIRLRGQHQFGGNHRSPHPQQSYNNDPADNYYNNSNRGRNNNSYGRGNHFNRHNNQNGMGDYQNNNNNNGGRWNFQSPNGVENNCHYGGNRSPHRNAKQHSADSPSQRITNNSDNNSPNHGYQGSPQYANRSQNFNNNTPRGGGGRGRGGNSRVGGRGGGSHNTPLSEVPVSKFISPSMFDDPWATVMNSKLTLVQREALVARDQEFNNVKSNVAIVNENKDTSLQSSTNNEDNTKMEIDESFVDSWQ